MFICCVGVTFRRLPFYSFNKRYGLCGEGDLTLVLQELAYFDDEKGN